MGTDAEPVTINITGTAEEVVPTIVASSESLTFAGYATLSYELPCNVKGLHLEDDISVTLNDENGVYSVSPTTIQPHEFSTEGLITPPEKEERNEGYGYVENYQNQGSAREIKHYSTEDEKLIEIEKSIMTLLVRYGEKKIDLMADDGQVVKMSVAEFVMGSLADDDLHFRHPLYEKMLQEVAQHVEESDFVAKNFLMSKDAMIVRSEIFVYQ